MAIKMKLIDWINKNRPGTLTEHEDRFEINHISGEHSTLFKKTYATKAIKWPLTGLEDLYVDFDGADLFSSTFKISSLESPKSVEGVELVSSQLTTNKLIKNRLIELPEKTIPFMYQAGIGFYTIGELSGKIYELDEEQNMISDTFNSLEDILNEWLDAIT
ncbi:hypothetical protein BFW38_05240 [Terasakiispira papahanaumokuakeensis]|uniref:Uncharacterized protein n=1 Tax=Terasakiispira papahanaumokuakeensis TaxID=197479 RepID=A0A1E2V7Q3_9GAMM|nr:hypothetical protein [Terasakiispira papahanaumokuakeensis]ODC03039.1 hypothetical protein BFW38_05240 [Terasakiispira papahanaumokuakeensis]